MVQIGDYEERTESKAEYKMPWTSRANDEITTRGWLAMRNRAMFLHPVAVSEICGGRCGYSSRGFSSGESDKYARATFFSITATLITKSTPIIANAMANTALYPAAL